MHRVTVEHGIAKNSIVCENVILPAIQSPDTFRTRIHYTVIGSNPLQESLVLGFKKEPPPHKMHNLRKCHSRLCLQQGARCAHRSLDWLAVAHRILSYAGTVVQLWKALGRPVIEFFTIHDVLPLRTPLDLGQFSDVVTSEGVNAQALLILGILP